MGKVKLIVEQQEYKEIEMEFDDMNEASLHAEKLIPYCSKKTKFTIVCEIEEVKGE
jgi:hypothetical protein